VTCSMIALQVWVKVAWVIRVPFSQAWSHARRGRRRGVRAVRDINAALLPQELHDTQQRKLRAAESKLTALSEMPSTSYNGASRQQQQPEGEEVAESNPRELVQAEVGARHARWRVVL
jgi:hypothetical protein